MNGDNHHAAPGGSDVQWQYDPDDSSDASPATPSYTGESDAVEWTASEFVEHSKSIGWYALLALCAGLLAVIVYVLTRDKVSFGIIVFVALMLGIAAARKPRVMNYAVTGDGLTVGRSFYSYGEFKSFSVMEEGPFSSVMLLPLKRFMAPINIYYDPKDENRIIEVLSRYLPIENHKHDFVDQIIRRIHF